MRLKFFVMFVVLGIVFGQFIEGVSMDSEFDFDEDVFSLRIGSGVFLVEGKNDVVMPGFFDAMYVSDFVRLYPEVSVVSFVENNVSVGFVNVFGGVGEDFIIYPEKEYEIVVKKLNDGGLI